MLRTRRRVVPALLVLALLLTAASGTYLITREDDPSSEVRALSDHDDRVAGLEPCDVPVNLLERVWRGYVPKRSGDVLTIEWDPNQFAGVRHSTPWPYTQDVPIVLYGPGFIERGLNVKRPVTVADLAPTFAELMNFDAFPASEREGSSLKEALLPEEERNGAPKLLFTLVWDGGGDNLLEQWPGAWPNLKQLIAEGVAYENATVGSSPSITPSIHTNIGTGAFPKTHGITDMAMRVNGKVVPSWAGTSPQRLRTQTLGDMWDAAMGNAPLVGMMARDIYHLGMVGYGAYLSGADHDFAVLADTESTKSRTNPDYYSMPSYLDDRKGLREAINEVDTRDGQADGEWRGFELSFNDPYLRYTPVWPIFETPRIVQLLENEGFGTDDVPDLFYMNYKSTDLAGHRWNLVEPQERDVLEEQDRQLPILIDAFNRIAGEGNWVLALTADHGITPYPRLTGGWSIEGDDVSADLERRFNKTPEQSSIVIANRGYQIFLDKKELKRQGARPEDVSAFLRDYRIEDNVTPTNEIGSSFQNRKKERVFITALTPGELQEALSCARQRQRN